MDLSSGGWRPPKENVDINENNPRTNKETEKIVSGGEGSASTRNIRHNDNILTSTTSASVTSQAQAQSLSDSLLEIIKTANNCSSLTTTITHAQAQTSPPTSTVASDQNMIQPHSNTCYPTHFQKGSLIQLANGQMKKVEDLSTEDFISSARSNPDVLLDQSTLTRIETKENTKNVILTFNVGSDKIEVRVSAPEEHPFFVYNRSWSSVSPEASLARYGLVCDQLRVGDICISLTQTLAAGGQPGQASAPL